MSGFLLTNSETGVYETGAPCATVLSVPGFSNIPERFMHHLGERVTVLYIPPTHPRERLKTVQHSLPPTLGRRSKTVQLCLPPTLGRRIRLFNPASHLPWGGGITVQPCLSSTLGRRV